MATTTISLNEQAFSLLKVYKEKQAKKSYSECIISLMSNDREDIQSVVERIVEKEIAKRTSY